MHLLCWLAILCQRLVAAPAVRQVPANLSLLVLFHDRATHTGGDCFAGGGSHQLFSRCAVCFCCLWICPALFQLSQVRAAVLGETLCPVMVNLFTFCLWSLFFNTTSGCRVASHAAYMAQSFVVCSFAFMSAERARCV